VLFFFRKNLNRGGLPAYLGIGSCAADVVKPLRNLPFFINANASIWERQALPPICMVASGSIPGSPELKSPAGLPIVCTGY